MKITRSQLRQLIVESMYSPSEIKINKLVKLINNSEEGLYQALELIKALELEAWNSGNLYSAIKAYSDKWQKEYDAEESYLHWMNHKGGRTNLKRNHGYINDERWDNFDDLGLKLYNLKNFLKKFDTSNMLWIDSPLMENR